MKSKKFKMNNATVHFRVFLSVCLMLLSFSVKAIATDESFNDNGAPFDKLKDILCLEVLVVKTDLQCQKPFHVLEDVDHKFNHVSMGTSINYRGKSVKDMSELADYFKQDCDIETVIHKSIPCSFLSHSIVSSKNLYNVINRSNKDDSHQDQPVELGFSFDFQPSLSSESEVELKILFEQVMPCTNPNYFTQSESCLVVCKEAMTADLIIPNGYFAILPDIAVENLQENPVQISFLGGLLTVSGGGLKHRKKFIQQGITLIVKPTIQEF